ncbi:hypothetical protein CROQUDRAFT_34986, partial [Cronartium quercuum f. sp. fusiforme G11]
EVETNLYTSTHSEIYVMSKTFCWIDRDVEIYDFEGKVAYLISYEDETGHLFKKETQFQLKSVQGKPGLTSDSEHGLCGFDHTYHATNGLRIKLSTKAFFPDKWYLE